MNFNNIVGWFKSWYEYDWVGAVALIVAIIFIGFLLPQVKPEWVSDPDMARDLVGIKLYEFYLVCSCIPALMSILLIYEYIHRNIGRTGKEYILFAIVYAVAWPLFIPGVFYMISKRDCKKPSHC